MDGLEPRYDPAVTAYSEGDGADAALVICDRTNPKAWLRSDTYAPPEP